MASRSPWCVTVPSALKPEDPQHATRAGEVIVFQYDEETQRGYIEVPYERTLRDIDEAKVWEDARVGWPLFDMRRPLLVGVP